MHTPSFSAIFGMGDRPCGRPPRPRMPRNEIEAKRRTLCGVPWRQRHPYRPEDHSGHLARSRVTS